MEPIDKVAERVRNNALSATVMLGHLCALYDRGVFEAARLMSNLLYQLAIIRRNNSPLLKQVGHFDRLKIVVDARTQSSAMTADATCSPLATPMFGLKKDPSGTLRSAALWVLASRRPPPFSGFATLGVDEWLDDPVIPTGGSKVFSRRELILAVRDKDGGAHSDPESKMTTSTDYLELVNAFPVSKLSSIQTPEGASLAWNLLPPVTLAILRQIAHELLSTIWSQSDLSELAYLPALVCKFDGTELLGAFVPEDYPNVGPVYGKQPAVVSRPRASP